MRPIAAVALVILATLSNVATAQQNRWLPLFKTEELDVEIDGKRLPPEAVRAAKFWTRWTYSKDRPLDASRRYRSSVALWYMDCTAMTTAMPFIAYYADEYGAGQVVDSIGGVSQAPLPRSFAETIPGSYGEYFVEEACKLIKPTARDDNIFKPPTGYRPPTKASR